MNKFCIIIVAYFGLSLFFFSCNHLKSKKNIIKDNVSIDIPDNWVEKIKDNVLFAFKINSYESLEYFKFIKIDKVALQLSINEILCESHEVWKNSKKVKYWGFDMNKISINNSIHFAGYLQMLDQDKEEFVLLFCLFEHDGFIYRMELGSYKNNLEKNQILFQELISSLKINGEETILLNEITGKHEKVDLDSLCENLKSEI
jgi:hypothetical protein